MIRIIITEESGVLLSTVTLDPTDINPRTGKLDANWIGTSIIDELPGDPDALASCSANPTRRTSNMLHLNYLKIANWEDVCLVDDPECPGKRVEHPWNLTMGIFMMHTGINTITRKNAAEFYMRAKLIEACFGSLFTNGDGTPRHLTTDDVAKYIGLSSNVSAYSKAQFFGHLRKNVIRNLTEHMESALRQAEKDAAMVAGFSRADDLGSARKPRKERGKHRQEADGRLPSAAARLCWDHTETTEDDPLKHKPTEEQLISKRAVMGGGHVLLSAYAGAAKTTSLIYISDDLPDEAGQYLAFNSAIAKSASTEFKRWVECRTTHSLAYHAVAKKYINAGKELPGRGVRRQRIHEVAGILGVTDGYRGKTAKLARNSLTYLAMQTVVRFCYSADDEIGTHHVPWNKNMALWEQQELAEVQALAVHFATIAWADIMALQGNLNYSHDYYLKQFQLSKPVIKKDYIMIDEGQDTNPATLDIFERQGDHAQLIMVGDTYQSIYQWRGAVDALSTFQADDTCFLTKSFRFGEAIADEANKWLTLLEADKPLEGFEKIESVVGPLDDPRAILCRTNATVIAETLAAQDAGRKVYVQGGTQEIKAFAEAAQSLMQGVPAQHPELIGFDNWDEVREYAAADESAKDLRTFVKLLDDYGVEKVLGIASSTVDKKEYADVITSTAHKSKGEEYESVRIASDFTPSEEDGDDPIGNAAEHRLAYVAVTRAKLRLDCEALAWVNDCLPSTNNKKDDKNAQASR